jgi:acyl-CoA thioester hydrolase
MGVDTPLCLHRGVIEPEWIDYNGHMNVAYYVLVFDRGTDGFLDYLGMDDWDAKRLHYFERLHREPDGMLAATTEILLTHMDMGSVRAAPMPANLQSNVAAVMRAHGEIPRPPQAGRVIGIGAGRPS